MAVLLVIATALVVAGSTFLQSLLNPHDHPLWFAIFWLVCAWLTVTAMLLGVFDILVVGKQKRAEARRLAEELARVQRRKR